MLSKLAYYLGGGVALGIMVQSGVPIPGIPPISAPGFWLNVGLWPAELLAGLLGRPIYLQGGTQIAPTMPPGATITIPTIQLPAIQQQWGG